MNRCTAQRAASVTAAMLLASVGYAANTPETEPNDNKAGAQLVSMACGDTVTGNTTGTSTTVAGAASADYFRIHTVGTGALTEYTLTMTSAAAAPLQTLTIRGLTQTAGVPNAGTDALIQTGFTVGTTKICRWYGTGAAGVDQDIVVGVTGTATSTTDYTLTLTCGPVTPTPMSGGTLTAGSVGVVPDTATSTALDTDWWVYDGALNPVPTFAHDDVDTTVISRTLGAGTYYIALGNYNLCNNQGNPADDTFRTGNVLDFPNVIQQSTSTNYPTANMTATSGSTTLTGTGGRPNPFEIPWYSFSVTPPTVPAGTGLATPSTAAITGTTLLTVATTPAANPTSTGLAVVANLSAINGSGSQAFYDDGSHGDVTAGDGTFSFSATLAEPMSPGALSLPFTVSDAQARSSTGSIALTATAAPTGRCCTSSTCAISTAYNCTQGGGTYGGNGSDCGSVSYTVSNSAAPYASISGTGTIATAASNVDDGGSTVAMPFTFNFYGTDYTSVWVCSNGFVQFGGTNSTTFGNVGIPNTGIPNNAIYPLWDDYNTINTVDAGAGDIYTQVDGVAPNRTFTVDWSHVTQYRIGAPLTYPQTDENFQVILYEGSNNIEFRYGALNGPCSTAVNQCSGIGNDGDDRTVGVENAAGTGAVDLGGLTIGTGNTARLLTYSAANPCAPSTGSCCTNNSCNVTTQGACTGTWTAGGVCNGPSSCNGGHFCGSADFNCDGDIGTDSDIVGFFSCLSGSCPALPCISSADFNGDGDIGTDADIEAFFRVLGGGAC